MSDVLNFNCPARRGRMSFGNGPAEWERRVDTARQEWGHDAGYYDVPYAAYLYIARRLKDLAIDFEYFDLQARPTMTLADFDALIADHRPRVLVTQVNLPSLESDLALVLRAERSFRA